jgi:hypothetical protein
MESMYKSNPNAKLNCLGVESKGFKVEGMEAQALFNRGSID